MKFLSSLKNKNLSGKICLLRVDLNIEADRRGFYTNNRSGLTRKIPLRITAIVPTIKFLTNRGAKVVILSHRGRPHKKIRNSKFEIRTFSLKPFAKILSGLLNKPVQFINFNNGAFNVPKLTSILRTSDVLKIKNFPPGSIFLLENLRFLPGEEKNDAKLAKRLVALGDFYVNDAFSVSHRKNASVAAITKFLPSYAGLLLEKEIFNLNRVLKNFRKPMVVVLGGAKMSDKMSLIKNFQSADRRRADYFLLGGGIANTVFAGQGLPVGDSLYDKNTDLRGLSLVGGRGFARNKKMLLPIDVVIDKRRILDIGQKTIEKYSNIIKKAKTIIWNGPMGYIENPKFAKGSLAITKAIMANKKAFAVVGGGETISIVSSVRCQVSGIFISTGGGAMLEYLAGKKLPGIEALKKHENIVIH